MLWIYILIFLFSCGLLAFSSRWLVDSLTKIAKYLRWKEFVAAFFIMAFGVSIPNFFVGITSALNKIPELSLGDIVGGNIVELSLIVGIAALISKMGLSAPSRTVQGSSIFTIMAAIFPLILIFDGNLSRIDGIVLIFVFAAYIFWIFSKEERFKKVYDEISEPMGSRFLFKNLGLFLSSFILLLLGSKGMVDSSIFFANYLNFPIALIGIFIVGLGNSLPEAFFEIQAAKKGQDWLFLGNLMGGVIITATLVLGTVALICPIEITNFSAIAIGRVFLAISAILFLIFLRTDKKITKKEGVILLTIYILFVICEIFLK